MLREAKENKLTTLSKEAIIQGKNTVFKYLLYEIATQQWQRKL